MAYPDWNSPDPWAVPSTGQVDPLAPAPGEFPPWSMGPAPHPVAPMPADVPPWGAGPPPLAPELAGAPPTMVLPASPQDAQPPPTMQERIALDRPPWEPQQAPAGQPQGQPSQPSQPQGMNGPRPEGPGIQVSNDPYADKKQALATSGAAESDFYTKKAQAQDDFNERERFESAQHATEVRAEIQEQRDQLARYQQANEEMGKLKADPKRWWNSLDAGTQLASYGGAIIAGILNPTGPNGVVALAERAIDRDLAAQEADRETKRAELGGQLNALTQMSNIMGNKEQAYYAIRAEKKGQLIGQIEADAARMQSVDAQAKASAGIADLELSRQSDLARAAEAERNYRLQKSQVAQGWAQESRLRKQNEQTNTLAWHDRAYGAQQDMFNRQAAQAKADAEQKGINPALIIPGVATVGADGKPGANYAVGLDPARTAKASEAIASETQKLQILHRIMYLREHGGEDVSLGEKAFGKQSAAGAEIEGLLVDYSKLDSVSKGGGALSDTEAKTYYEKKFGGGRTFFANPAFKAAVVGMIRSSETSASTTLFSVTGQKGHYIYDPESQQFIPAPRGFKDDDARFVMPEAEQKKKKAELQKTTGGMPFVGAYRNAVGQ